VIRVRGLHKRYGSRVVLAGVDLDVARGETVAILGPSGAGKSTLLRCLNGLEPFDAGVVAVDDLTLQPGLERRHDASVKRRLRARVGLVFQQFELFPHLRAVANVALAPRLTLGLTSSESDARARALLARVDLGDRADAWPHELSGGQQQRVAIARALALEPSVLLLDEPTSALDPATREALRDLIAGLSADGVTIVIVTHEPAFAAGLASRRVILSDGLLRASD
jgi:polar amino acid transport system ATP-binding protein